MRNPLSLTIVTPERIVFESPVYEIIVPTKEGVLTILPGHIPLVSVLETGVLRVRSDKNDKDYGVFAVHGGVIEVRTEDSVVIMPDRTEHADEIDIARAEQSYEELQQQKRNTSDVDFARFDSLIKKEINRIHVAKNWSRKGKNPS